jgi:hypothetical protein
MIGCYWIVLETKYKYPILAQSIHSWMTGLTTKDCDYFHHLFARKIYKVEVSA